jgi:hypothetical protein
MFFLLLGFFLYGTGTRITAQDLHWLARIKFATNMKCPKIQMFLVVETLFDTRTTKKMKNSLVGHISM